MWAHTNVVNKLRKTKLIAVILFVFSRKGDQKVRPLSLVKISRD